MFYSSIAHIQTWTMRFTNLRQWTYIQFIISYIYINHTAAISRKYKFIHTLSHSDRRVAESWNLLNALVGIRTRVHRVIGDYCFKLLRHRATIYWNNKLLAIIVVLQVTTYLEHKCIFNVSAHHLERSSKQLRQWQRPVYLRKQEGQSTPCDLVLFDAFPLDARERNFPVGNCDGELWEDSEPRLVILRPLHRNCLRCDVCAWTKQCRVHEQRNCSEPDCCPSMQTKE